MPLLLNCGESHPFVTKFQTDRYGFRKLAQTVRDYPDIEALRIVERKRIADHSYVVVERTSHGFGHNFFLTGEAEVRCPECGSDRKLKILSATL